MGHLIDRGMFAFVRVLKDTSHELFCTFWMQDAGVTTIPVTFLFVCLLLE